MSNYSELNLLNPSAKFSNLSFRQCKIIWKDRIRSLLRQPSWNGLLCHQFGLKRSGGRWLCYSDCKRHRLRRLHSHLSPHINNFIYLYQLFVNKKIGALLTNYLHLRNQFNEWITVMRLEAFTWSGVEIFQFKIIRSFQSKTESLGFPFLPPENIFRKTARTSAHVGKIQ